jgi:hypothetical protein
MKLTTHLSLVLALRMHGAVPPYMLYSFITWFLGTGTTLSNICYSVVVNSPALYNGGLGPNLGIKLAVLTEGVYCVLLQFIQTSV